MVEDTTNRPRDAEPPRKFPDADLSARHIRELVEALPKDFVNEVTRTERDARALAHLVLKLVDEWKRSTETLEQLLKEETSGVDNGGDIINSVAIEIGLSVIAEVVVGIHYTIDAHLPGIYDADQARETLQRHAADHVRRVGEPVLLTDSAHQGSLDTRLDLLEKSTKELRALTNTVVQQANEAQPRRRQKLVDRLPDPEDQPDAHYSAALDAIAVAFGRDFARNFDSAVGVRLVEAQTLGQRVGATAATQLLTKGEVEDGLLL